MNIGEVLNGVYDDELGWRPASGGVKPVHIANGVMRAIVGRSNDITPLVEVISWRRRGSPIEERRLDALLEKDWGDAIKAFADDAPGFERARRYLHGVLAADGAVFPSPEHSSVTLTCAQMASRDGNDRGLGEFGFFLLGGDRQSPLPKLLADRMLVDRPTDPVTIAAWPLLVGDGRPAKLSERSSHSLKKKHSQTILAEFRAAASSLVSHEETQGNRLRSLERTVHFVCVATHAHAQAVAANGKLDTRPPALLVAEAAKGSDLAIASERSLRLIHDRFGQWLAERLADRLNAGKPCTDDEVLEVPSGTDGREFRKILRTIGVAKKPHEEPDEDVLDARMSAFNEARRRFGKDEPAACLGATLVECYLREYESGGPREALTRLCARAGLLYPHYQGRSTEKRFQPSAPVLDMLVRACVTANEAIPLTEFLERLWHRFGLIAGDRRNDHWDDGAYLHEHGLAVDPGRLRANTDALVSQLVTMGLARRYPDNVTFIGAAHAG
mgnify:CR=1 FL=1